MENNNQELKEIEPLGPDYCYVCQRLIRRAQKKVCAGGDYYRHSSCKPGSANWKKSPIVAHPKYEEYTKVLAKAKPKEGEELWTWDEIHSMEREELYEILEEEGVPEEDYMDMNIKELADTICVYFGIKKPKKVKQTR